MGYPDIFNPNTTEALIARVEQLTPETQPLWGKMTVDQMLAHCSLAYEYNNGQRQTKIPAFMKWLLRGMMRRVIAGERPYKKNSPTASYFKVGDTAVFTVEKDRLLQNIRSYQEAGAADATGRPHAWLGKMSAEDWSVTMFKHIDHHLTQFGV